MKLRHAQVLVILLGAACSQTSAAPPAAPGDVNLCVWPSGCYLADGSCRRLLSPGDMGVGDLGLVQQLPYDLGAGDLGGLTQQGPESTDYALVCPMTYTTTSTFCEMGPSCAVPVTCALQEDACPALGPLCGGGCARPGQAESGQPCVGPTAPPIQSAFGVRCQFPDDVCCQVVDAGTMDAAPPKDM